MPPKRRLEETRREEIEEITKRMTIRYPPIFTRGVPPVTVRKGETRTIGVQVDAQPPARIDWYLNEQRVTENVVEEITIREEINRSTITMPFQKQGILKAVATNEVGTQTSEGPVIFEQPPPPPIRRKDVSKRDVTVTEETREMGK